MKIPFPHTNKYITMFWPFITKTFSEQKKFWSNPANALSATLSLLVFIASLVINFSAGTYADISSSNYVKDIILDNIPVYETKFIFIYGALFVVFFVLFLLFIMPRYLPFLLKSVALLIVIRSLFVIMTHLAPYPERAFLPTNNFIGKFTFGADLFFSGHTALPYILALIYWPNKPLRIIFLLFSAVFAISVLLGHLHYSIDVFGAYFITYSVYRISVEFFKEEYDMTQKTVA